MILPKYVSMYFIWKFDQITSTKKSDILIN